MLIMKLKKIKNLIVFHIELKETESLKQAMVIITRLKNNTENSSTWEGAFYQSKWVKITQVELF